MGLEILEVGFSTNTEIINIKESRKIRKQKIEIKQTYHKKHPKSVEYYGNLANNELVNDSLLGENHLANMSEIKIDSQHIMKDIKMNMSNFDITVEKSTNKETMDLEYKIQNTGDISPTNEQKKKIHSSKSASSKNSHHHGRRNSRSTDEKSTIKNKNQLQLMYQSLSKMVRRDNIFFDTNPQFNSIFVMKDFNVQTFIGENKVSLSLRAVIGEYSQFKDLVLTNHGNFNLLKNDFQDWLNTTLRHYDASEILESTLDKVFSKYNQQPLFKKLVHSLEQKLISVLKKPTKQPNGFIKKIEQVESQWAEEAQEISHIEQIENQLNFKSYEESFPLARSMKRKFSIFIGKTNSGKTYAAMNELAKGRNGVYLAPLRLMAQEGQESLMSREVIADLITGEEQNKNPDSTHISSTIEMCNMSKCIEVAVIDEIQMIADESRGWAWSQALIGVPAEHVILVGSEESLPYIIPVLKELGESYKIERFERKTPLDLCDPITNLKEVKEGDCVVVFSRKSALEMKNAIEAKGKRCSVIYGNLSPEVRRSEAKKFKSGENPILVATDAIGMGLNLPIKRVFFSTLQKFDGMENRYLNSSEIKQISGRAGRYGLAEKGLVGLLFNESHSENTILHKAIYGDYDKPDDTRISIAPNLKQIQTICNTLGKQDLYSALIFFKEKLIRDNKLYKAANLESMIEIASLIKNKNLDLATGLNYACVPLDTNSEIHTKYFFKWLNNHISGKENPAPQLPDVVIDEKNDSYSLYEAENYVKLLMAYRWLHYKYSDIYPDIEEVINNAKLTNVFIEQALHHHIIISKNPRWRK